MPEPPPVRAHRFQLRGGICRAPPAGVIVMVTEDRAGLAAHGWDSLVGARAPRSPAALPVVWQHRGGQTPETASRGGAAATQASIASKIPGALHSKADHEFGSGRLGETRKLEYSVAQRLGAIV